MLTAARPMPENAKTTHARVSSVERYTENVQQAFADEEGDQPCRAPPAAPAAAVKIHLRLSGS